MNHVFNQVPKASAVEAKQAWEAMARHSSFALHEPEMLAVKLRDAANTGKKLDSKFVDGLFGDVKAAKDQVSDFFASKVKNTRVGADRKVPKSKQIPEKPIPISPARANKSGGFLAHLEPQQRVGFGISAIIAAGSALATVSALSKMKQADANGESKYQPSQVGMALINGLLTAGFAYAAHQQYHGRF